MQALTIGWVVANIILGTYGLTKHVGSGESGKSTIVKQMKIIHQNGYSVEELEQYRHTIYKNIIDCAKALIFGMKQFEISPQGPDTPRAVELLSDYTIDPDPDQPLDPRVGEAVATLWKDTCIPKVFEHQNAFYIMDSAP